MSLQPAVISHGGTPYRYAQLRRGLRLHLARMEADGFVRPTTLCGRHARQPWRLTCNLPLGNPCRTCQRAIGLA